MPYKVYNIIIKSMDPKENKFSVYAVLCSPAHIVYAYLKLIDLTSSHLMELKLYNE